MCLRIKVFLVPRSRWPQVAALRSCGCIRRFLGRLCLGGTRASVGFMRRLNPLARTAVPWMRPEFCVSSAPSTPRVASWCVPSPRPGIVGNSTPSRMKSYPRLGLLWLFYDWRQIPRDLADIIKSAGVNYHLHPSSKHTYKSLLEEIEPITLEEAMSTPRYHAINVIRSGGTAALPFVARRLPPPSAR